MHSGRKSLPYLHTSDSIYEGYMKDSESIQGHISTVHKAPANIRNPSPSSPDVSAGLSDLLLSLEGVESLEGF